MNMAPIGRRFSAFGWACKEIDGNNMGEVVGALTALPFKKRKPSLIVARTVKAKGLSFAEGKLAYHYWKPNADELEQAEQELSEAEQRLEAALKGGDA